MQDIGGLRVIVNTLADVYRLRDSLQTSQMKHEAVCHPMTASAPRSRTAAAAIIRSIASKAQSIQSCTN